MPKKHSLTKLLRIPNVYSWGGGLSVSPDGQHAAVNWNKTGSWEIWLVSLAGSQAGQKRPKKITGGWESKTAPRFSPDGSRLAYLQDHEGDENFDIHIYDLATGETRNAMPDTPDALYDKFSWSPDGRHIALISNRGGRFAVHTLEVATGQLARVVNHPYSDTDVAWSPDGEHIALTAHTQGQDSNIFIVPARGGELRALADKSGPLDAATPCWSPDGKRLAFVGWPNGNADIGVWELESGEIDWVATEKWDEENPAWSPDGGAIVYTVNRDGDVSLNVVQIESGRRKKFAIESGYHSDPQFTLSEASGDSIVCVFHNSRRPGDLWKLSLKSGRWTQLTHSAPAEVKPGDFILPQPVRWKAPDGLTIPGLLFQPKGRAKRRPAILYIHGGPSWQSMIVWSPLIQTWLAEGWAVLCPNYRGSTGYGKEFQTANRFVLGRADIADIVAGADFLIRKGLADPEQIAITGASYGGYMTMAGLTRYPDRFAAGSAVVPFLDWFTEFASEREDLRYWDLQNMGDPEIDEDRFREASPMFFLHRINAPVQMLAGAHDPRCPAAETEKAEAELKRLGKIHETIIFPDEGHGFLKLKNKLTAYQRQLRLLKRHLK
ncbi:MAG: S9 family peptidase [Chloroflexi bacterium]|nr:S9 family peptidase [Chloroflexota bacterium]